MISKFHVVVWIYTITFDVIKEIVFFYIWSIIILMNKWVSEFNWHHDCIGSYLCHWFTTKWAVVYTNICIGIPNHACTEKNKVMYKMKILTWNNTIVREIVSSVFALEWYILKNHWTVQTRVWSLYHCQNCHDQIPNQHYFQLSFNNLFGCNIPNYFEPPNINGLKTVESFFSDWNANETYELL